MKIYFITGTDTHVGKTYVSSILLQSWKIQGFSTLALKPIASGCFNQNRHCLNEDALTLQRHASVAFPIKKINPFAFTDAIAPHIAAQKLGTPLTKQAVLTQIQSLIKQSPAERILIEGAGGWLLPLNDRECYSEVIADLNIPVILVVGMRLGCINHSRLTYQAIKASSVTWAGWIANDVDPHMLAVKENIESLKHWLPEPFLGQVAFGQGHAMLTSTL